LRHLVTAILLATLLTPATADAISVRYAKKRITNLIVTQPDYKRGSVYVARCRRGYTTVGRPRVLCDVYFETRDFRAWCGWGRVVEYRTFYKRSYDTRRC
jgi:hypothetical protein